MMLHMVGVQERIGSDGTALAAPRLSAEVLKRIGIVGTGLIGASAGRALRASGLEVVGVDSDPSHLQQAAHIGAIDFGGGLDELADCDVVLVAVSNGSVARTIEQVLEVVPDDVTVLDVASVKGPINETVDAPNFCGSHPIRGGHTSGPGEAKADLFVGATWAVCPTSHTSANAVADTSALIRNAGGEPVLIDALVHDELVARTSHLPHVVAAALVTVVAANDTEASFAFTGGGFRDTTRIARSDLGWAEICLMNREAVVPAIEALERGLADIRRALVACDAAAAERFFSEPADLLRIHLPS